MKICILLQRRFAFVGHNLAVLLKEKYGVDEFCGYVYWRGSYNFLRSQKNFAYTSLLLDEDVHAQYKNETIDWQYLNNLERELGIPNLWGYIALDRVLMFNQLVREYPYNTPHYTYTEMLQIFQVKAKAILSFFDTEKPDAIILPNVGGIGAMLLYQLAKKKGVKIFHIMPTSMKDRFTLSETYDSFSSIEEIFKKTFAAHDTNSQLYAEAKKILTAFREQPVAYNAELTPDKQPVNRFRQLRFLKPKNFIRSIAWFGQVLKTHATSAERHDYSYIHPWYYLVDRFKRKFRNLRGTIDLYDTFNREVPYVFFGLHYEPEVSLLLQASFITDQIYAVRQLARSLPVGYFVYVKDHPLMVPFRPRSYYKELKKIPNVRLMNPNLWSFDLIKTARLVSSITGSVVWEGLMLGKPGIVFGHQFYNALSMVKYVREMETLPYLITEQLEKFVYNEEELLHYISAILSDSALLRYYHLWEQETNEEEKRNGLRPLADLVAEKLHLTEISK